jgi:hypothetical protein
MVIQAILLWKSNKSLKSFRKKCIFSSFIISKRASIKKIEKLRENFFKFIHYLKPWLETAFQLYLKVSKIDILS